MFMRRLALIIALGGLFVLYLSFFSLPVPFSRENVSPRQIVAFSGEVDRERIISPTFRLLFFDNLTIACSCSRSYLDKEILVVGSWEEYEGDLQIRVHTIRLIK